MKTTPPLGSAVPRLPGRRSFLQGVVAGLVICPLRYGLDLVQPGRLRPSRSQEVERLVRQGVLQHGREEYQAAVVTFTQALDLDPDCQPAYRHRGESRLAADDLRRAVEDLTTAIRLDPTDEEAFDARGVAFLVMNEDDKAIADRTAILRLDPSPFNFYLRGVYALKHDPDLAVADFTEAIRHNPQHADAYILRGWSYEEKGDYEQAAADFVENMRLDPPNAEWVAEEFRRVKERAS